MSIRFEKPWRELTEPEIAQLGGELGVYQLADSEGHVIRIGYAGGRSLFGLRGELEDRRKQHRGRALRFRVEVTSQYLSRYEELLMIYKADFGVLPSENAAEQDRRLGRLHPA